MRYNPIRDRGMAIAGYAMGANRGYNYMRHGEISESISALKRPLDEARAAGSWARTSSAPVQFRTLFAHTAFGAYICGEETALLESIEGKKGQPRFKPPFPASFGLYGKPTTINNTETFASIPFILKMGGEEFLNLGKPNNGGTKLFSVSGHVNRPGNYEIPGTPFATLLEMAVACAAGASSRRSFPGVLSTGRSRRCDDAVHHGLRLHRQSRFHARFRRGHRHGRNRVYGQGPGTTVVLLLRRVLRPMHALPEGTAWMYKVIPSHRERIGQAGRPGPAEQRAGQHHGAHHLCPGDAAAMPVQSFLKHFRSANSSITSKQDLSGAQGCAVGGRLPQDSGLTAQLTKKLATR